VGVLRMHQRLTHRACAASAQAHKFRDIRYHTCAEGIAKITINRPEVHNAFRPLTVQVCGRCVAPR